MFFLFADSGRVCLFGEHSDWAGNFRRFNSAIDPGQCIVAGTNQGLYSMVTRHTRLVLRSVLQSGDEQSIMVSRAPPPPHPTLHACITGNCGARASVLRTQNLLARPDTRTHASVCCQDHSVARADL